jgi:hypothetical protein
MARRRKRDRTSKGHKAAEFAMASGSQERLKMYLDRGRRFADSAQTSFSERSSQPM